MVASVRFEGARDGERDLVPVGGLGLELPCARAGELVEFGAAVVLGLAPGRGQPAVAFHAMQGGEERPGLDLEDAAGHQADAAGDAESVELAAVEGAEDEEVEGALEEVHIECLYELV